MRYQVQDVYDETVLGSFDNLEEAERFLASVEASLDYGGEIIDTEPEPEPEPLSIGETPFEEGGCPAIARIKNPVRVAAWLGEEGYVLPGGYFQVRRVLENGEGDGVAKPGDVILGHGPVPRWALVQAHNNVVDMAGCNAQAHLGPCAKGEKKDWYACGTCPYRKIV